jgi:hypothetical protein
MEILFDVTTDKPETVEYNGETFEVFGHVQILAPDETQPTDA